MILVHQGDAHLAGAQDLLLTVNLELGAPLEDEKDLRNGYKLCIYSGGYTITIPNYKICPISLDVD